MKNNTKVNLLKAAIATAALLSATTASAYTVTVDGTQIGTTGQHTNVAGALQNTFDVANTFGSYTGGTFVSGNLGYAAAPPNDTTIYMSAGETDGQSSPVTLSLGFLANYFGYYGGSPDQYNSVAFYNTELGGEAIRTFSGGELADIGGFDGDGDQTDGAYWNFFAEGPSEYFNTIKFFSSKNAFETDNHAVSAVPLPAAAWLFGSALLGFAGFSNRRKV